MEPNILENGKMIKRMALVFSKHRISHILAHSRMTKNMVQENTFTLLAKIELEFGKTIKL